jgi:hypothetical protein
MDDRVFEGRVLELVFKTDSQITPQFVAYKLGIAVDEARHRLDAMVTRDVLTLESDDNGALYYHMANRPPPTREPLSWQPAQAAPSPQMPAYPPPAPYYPPPAMPVMMPPPPVYLGQEKSVASAIVLSFFFGPLGMLYSTVAGALVMFFVGGPPLRADRRADGGVAEAKRHRVIRAIAVDIDVVGEQAIERRVHLE